MFPKDRRYTKEHEWVLAEGGVATVGITDFAQHELGDITHVELPEVGRVYAAGESLGAIDSVKAVSEVYAPVSGRVTEVNGLLEDDENAKTLNSDPHGAGWICKLEISDPSELDALMDVAAYEAYAAR